MFTTTGHTTWDTFKSLWRYGLTSPITVYRAAQQAANKFYKTYDDSKPWEAWGRWLDDHNFSEYLNVSIREYLRGKNVSDKFIDEIVEVGCCMAAWIWRVQVRVKHWNQLIPRLMTTL